MYFAELYNTIKNNGHIPEDVQERLGFIKDTDYDGEDVEKPDGISQEMRHRAKILSHHLQRSLRMRKELDAAKNITQRLRKQ